MASLALSTHPCIALVTLWTKKEQILENLHQEEYAFVGQLYSKQEGINALLRSLLLHKNIRHLVITGNDLSGSGAALLSFFEKGIINHTILGATDVSLDTEIPASSLEELRKQVSVYDYRDLKDFSQLRSILSKLSVLPSYGAPEQFPEKKVLLPQTLPSEQSDFVVRHGFVFDAWVELLSLIMRFGTVKKSEYDLEQRELLNLITVIESENPDSPQLSPFFPFTQKDLDAYYPHITTSAAIEGVEYSYGQRLRTPLDQIQQIITALQKTPYTRRAIAITWDVKKDIFSEKPPCLILTEFTIQNSLLYLTAFFRSNDMYQAWPRNAFGLRKLQTLVANNLHIALGSLTIISQSAHIYQNNWAAVDHLLHSKTPSSQLYQDPRGNFIIYIEEQSICVTHLSPSGIVLHQFKDTDVVRLLETVRPYVSEMSHALYLGAELQRASFALQHNIPFVQDQSFE